MRRRLQVRSPRRAHPARRAAAAAARGRAAALPLEAVLDLLEEHVYAGELRPDGSYVAHWSPRTLARVLGGRPAAGVDPVGIFESRIVAEDRPKYAQFGHRLLAGEEAEATYRVHGLDGVTRLLRDRARSRRRADGRVLVHGILSDITARAEADARAAEASERFTSLLDVVGAHVYLALVLPDGRMREVFQGPGADRLLGGAEPDPDMVNWEAALHPEDRAAYEDFNARLASGEAVEVEYRLRGADGVTRWVNDRAATRRRDDGIVEVSGIVSDVTERRRLEDELRRSFAEMEAAHRELERARSAAEQRARTDALTGTYARSHFVELAEARLACGLRSGGLVLLDADHFKQVNDVYGHAVGDAVLIELARRLRGALADGDLLGRWGGEEFAVLLADVASDAELERRAEALRTAVGHAPISAAGVTLNQTVSLGAVRCGALVATVDALVEAADRRLYAAKRGGRNRVSLVAEPSAGTSSGAPEAIGMARALAFAASVRDKESEAHAGEVSLLASLVAERLELPEASVWRCRLGGLLHDVGKVAIPDRILDKPAALDEAEWELMRTHPAIGADIVGRFAPLREAAATVRHHHERYDGGGHPDGLAGPAIPIEARIVAAVDAYSAMTATRPYSPARTPAEAANELRAVAGSQLDPDVVAALIDVLGPLVRGAWRGLTRTPAP